MRLWFMLMARSSISAWVSLQRSLAVIAFSGRAFVLNLDGIQIASQGGLGTPSPTRTDERPFELVGEHG
jgi:hypothetical protein